MQIQLFNEDDVRKQRQITVAAADVRRQAIEDGTLVQLNGADYEGDRWVPKMVNEAGFKGNLVDITTDAFTTCVAPLDGEQLAVCQDIEGRLWDVLFVARQSIVKQDGVSADYDLVVVPNVPVGDRRSTQPRRRVVQLHAAVSGINVTISLRQPI